MYCACRRASRSAGQPIGPMPDKHQVRLEWHVVVERGQGSRPTATVHKGETRERGVSMTGLPSTCLRQPVNLSSQLSLPKSLSEPRTCTRNNVTGPQSQKLFLSKVWARRRLVASVNAKIQGCNSQAGLVKPCLEDPTLSGWKFSEVPWWL